jgi:hypothetical protein
MNFKYDLRSKTGNNLSVLSPMDLAYANVKQDYRQVVDRALSIVSDPSAAARVDAPIDHG